MIYLENITDSQRIFIPRNDNPTGITGHTIALQTKDYTINENGSYPIRPDADYDGISGGTIGVYVSAATGVTFEHLDASNDGIYVPSGDGVYTGVTVTAGSEKYEEGFNDGYVSGYTSGETDGYASGYTSGSTDGYASGYTSGHTDGYSDGREAQKELLSSTTITSNGTYTRENGWSGVTVNVPGRIPVLENITINTNGTYAPPTGVDGYNRITVDVQSTGGTYEQGYQDGRNYQKSLLSSATITSLDDSIISENGLSAVTTDISSVDIGIPVSINGTTVVEPSDYNAECFRKVTLFVDVPQTGSTPVLTATTITQNGRYLPPSGTDGFSSVDVTVPDRYNEGYGDGYGVGYSSGKTDGDAEGYASGVTDGYSSGYTAGYSTGSSDGYSSGYTEGSSAGYSSGYTDGVDYQKSQLSSTTITTNGTYTRADGWDSVTVNVPFVVTMTQAEYDALAVKDPNIIYLIKN